MTIFGEFAKITQGALVLGGREIKIANSHSAMENGISLVPEDRKRHGLVLMQSVLKNISLPNLDRFAGFLRIDQNAEVVESLRIAKELAIKTPSLHVPVETLSGGNQQKEVPRSSSWTIPHVAWTWALNTKSTNS
jgi:D-xylose transport system ATP-binding protein